MWEWIVIPMLTMAIGFLLGFMTADTASVNQDIDAMRKEQRKIRQQLMKMQREENE